MDLFDQIDATATLNTTGVVGAPFGVGSGVGAGVGVGGGRTPAQTAIMEADGEYLDMLSNGFPAPTTATALDAFMRLQEGSASQESISGTGAAFINTVNAFMVELHNRYTTLSKQAHTASTLAAPLAKELTEAKERIVKLIAELEELRKQWEEQNAAMEQLQAAYKTLKQNKSITPAQHKAALAKLNKDLEAEKERSADLAKQLAVLSLAPQVVVKATPAAALTTSSTEDVAIAAASAAAALREKDAKIARRDAKVKELEGRVAQLEAENESAIMKTAAKVNAKWEGRIADLEKAKAAAETAAGERGTEVDALKKRLADADQGVAEAKKERARAMAELHECRLEADKRKAEVAVRETAAAEMEKEILRKREEMRLMAEDAKKQEVVLRAAREKLDADTAGFQKWRRHFARSCFGDLVEVPKSPDPTELPAPPPLAPEAEVVVAAEEVIDVDALLDEAAAEDLETDLAQNKVSHSGYMRAGARTRERGGQGGGDGAGRSGGSSCSSFYSDSDSGFGSDPGPSCG